MQTLTNSAFLQSLGYAIANSLWQAALVWILLVVITSFFKLSATGKYRFAVAAQLTVFAWFVSTFQYYYNAFNTALNEAILISGNANIELVNNAAPVGFTGYLLHYIIKGESLLPYLSIAYLLVLVLLAVKWVKAYKYTQHIAKHGLEKIDIDYKLFTRKVAEQLGITKKVSIHLSSIVKSPLTLGFWKPIILIPVASINNLTTSQLEAIILHELAHIRRFDYVVNIGLSITEAILYFNPFTHLIGKQIKKERENSCDDLVLQFQYNAGMYAEALLQIAYMQLTPSLAMAAANDQGVLLARVRRMIDQKQNKFNYRTPLIALLLLTIIITFASFFNVPQKTTSNNRQTLKQLVAEPVAISIDNPLFSPIFFLRKPLMDEVKRNWEQLPALDAEMTEAIAVSNESKDVFAMAPATLHKMAEIKSDETEAQHLASEAEALAVAYANLPAEPFYEAVERTVFDNAATTERIPGYKFELSNVFSNIGRQFQQLKDYTLEPLKVFKTKDDAVKEVTVVGRKIILSDKQRSEMLLKKVKLDSLKNTFEKLNASKLKTFNFDDVSFDHDWTDATTNAVYVVNGQKAKEETTSSFSYQYDNATSIAIARSKSAEDAAKAKQKVRTISFSQTDSTGTKCFKIVISKNPSDTTKKQIVVEVTEKKAF